jgi:hypothetical protein
LRCVLRKIVVRTRNTAVKSMSVVYCTYMNGVQLSGSMLELAHECCGDFGFHEKNLENIKKNWPLEFIGHSFLGQHFLNIRLMVSKSAEFYEDFKNINWHEQPKRLFQKGVNLGLLEFFIKKCLLSWNNFL